MKALSQVCACPTAGLAGVAAACVGVVSHINPVIRIARRARGRGAAGVDLTPRVLSRTRFARGSRVTRCATIGGSSGVAIRARIIKGGGGAAESRKRDKGQ